jgi:hypothetical protein
MATIVEIKDLSKDFIVNEGILHALKNINLIKTNTSQLKCAYSTFF